MTLTEAQQRAMDQLPITYDALNPQTTEDIQWQTIEALHRQGLVTFNHEGMGSEEREHVIVIERGRGGSSSW
jgi:hypothetical protein